MTPARQTPRWLDALAVHRRTSRAPLAWQSLRLPPHLRIVVLGPHPDDFDAIAITLRCLRDSGNPIFVAVLASGASGVEDSFCAPPTLAKKTRLREIEQCASCTRFGLPRRRLTFLRIPEERDGHIRDAPAHERTLRAYLQRRRPDIVFLPHGRDTNPDHRVTAAMVRRIGAAWPRPLATFLIRDPKTTAMRVDVVTPFGDAEARWKAGLLRCHRSQHQRNLNTRGCGFDARILDVNRRIATECGVPAPYAEAFEVMLAGVRSRPGKDAAGARHVR